MRDSVVFYRSFYEAVKNLPPEEFKESMQAILDYSFDGKPPGTQGSIAHTVFTLVKPQIDANIQRYEGEIMPDIESLSKVVENGRKSACDGVDSYITGK